ncbi:MAG: nucleoside triphosphate pyrophosphohydrolase [Nitrospiraceae bacterium]|nr:nucleoside triphosphate pyrophosphohydrolase [Nitrospiraceae bacterium]
MKNIPEKAGSEFERLLEITRALRERCPWDRQQTMKSLKPYIVEESYEVLEAIDEEDPEKIKEELGDLLFQIVFQAHMAGEKGLFDIVDVVRSISEKMVGRHPHVFGEDKGVKTAGDVLSRWQEHKKREGKLKSGMLEGIPISLPALLRAQKVQKRASRAGFDWRRTEDVLEKMDEEAGELREAAKTGDRDRIEDELGDMLFSMVNVARFLNIQAEEALGKTTARFIRRFGYIEKKAAGRGVELSKMSLAEMDALWEEAKRLEDREED